MYKCLREGKLRSQRKERGLEREIEREERREQEVERESKEDRETGPVKKRRNRRLREEEATDKRR
ncbi:hypothetical protein LguiA_017037 [Lonicera macranthoides]